MGKSRRPRLSRKTYERELERLEVELVKLQYWIRAEGRRVVVVFEGRDAAGKGGVIKTITSRLNPRVVRVVALTKPTERERGQWYFQRYVEQLPTAGEMVLFDRSWYNRAGVERVMGFCTEAEYKAFLSACPEFEHQLTNDGVTLIKYWMHVSDEVQEKRFQERNDDGRKRWKLSGIDIEGRNRSEEYLRARDEMLDHTDTSYAPWYVVDADDKRRGRLNCIRHLLSLLPYEDLTPEPVELGPRPATGGYRGRGLEELNVVPDRSPGDG